VNQRIEKRILLGITGASGSIYADRILQFLLDHHARVYLIITKSAEQVIQHELENKSNLIRILKGDLTPNEKEYLRRFPIDDLFAPVASGSSCPDAMIVLPCSMGTLARIAHGMSSNLLERSADVVLKQKKTLIVCPRETPLHAIHLQNMLQLTQAGATMVPPMPAFYQNPKSIDDIVDFVVGRVLEMLEIPHDLYRKWNSRMI